MAVYRFSASIVKRSGGRSATAAAAYRSAERIYDERTGQDHDYRRRGGVEHAEIITPDHAPDWMRERSRLWNAVEQAEKRKDAQLARELQLALPHELSREQRIELVREFVREEFVSRGMVADIAVHAPDRDADERNHHAHVLLTLREVTGEGFGNKRREWNDTRLLEQWREKWADFQNRALERAGSRERVDHRSNEARGIDREPEPKLGPHASEMEKRGKRSERGDLRQEAQERNRLRAELRLEAEAITKALSIEDRKAREAAGREMAEQYRKAAGQREEAGPGEQDRTADERARAYQKRRFEQWANTKRAELQSRQHDDKGDLGRRHDRQRQILEDRLQEFYGEGIDQAKQILAGIEERQQGKKLNRFLYRMSGQEKRDREAAEAARQNIANIEKRMAELHGRLDRKQEKERLDLDDKHREEWRNLEDRIKNAYERREREGWKAQPRPERKAANDRGREPGRDAGPEPGVANGSWDRGGRLRSP